MIIFLLGFWFLCASMFFNRAAQHFGITLSRSFILFQALLAVTTIFLHATLVYSAETAAIFMIAGFFSGFFMEWIGMKTGLIFGRYSYAKNSGPTLWGNVPLAIPLMWCVISYMAFSMSTLIFDIIGFSDAYGMLIVNAAILTMLWDFVADPLAVAEDGWKWEAPGIYYGIPAHNFAGWFATALLIFTLFFSIASPTPSSNVSVFIVSLPALGYCLMTAIFARACFEREFRLAAAIGFTTTLICFCFWLYYVL